VRPPALVIATSWLAAVLFACRPGPIDHRDPPERIRLSFFAVGDTGAVPSRVGRSLDTQMRVASVLEDEQRRRPADALVLLGDNFYPDGLREAEIADRLRENLVRPYCVFLALDGPASASVADVCEPARRGDHPVPIYAVLGNHDFDLPESPKLQRETVARFVPSWHVPSGSIEVVELADSDLVPSVSLILFEPETLADTGDAETLERALREARGPWRVLAGHFPITDQAPGPWLRKTLDAIDVPVQLLLGGHEHNLQIGTPPSGDPALIAVAGSGSSARRIRHRAEGSRFALEQPGYARVDLVGDGLAERLVVSLVAIPDLPDAVWNAPRVVQRWSVGRAGDTREEPLDVQ
jgi:hypothetical protein